MSSEHFMHLKWLATLEYKQNFDEFMYWHSLQYIDVTPWFSTWRKMETTLHLFFKERKCRPGKSDPSTSIREAHVLQNGWSLNANNQSPPRDTLPRPAREGHRGSKKTFPLGASVLSRVLALTRYTVWALSRPAPPPPATSGWPCSTRGLPSSATGLMTATPLGPRPTFVVSACIECDCARACDTRTQARICMCLHASRRQAQPAAAEKNKSDARIEEGGRGRGRGRLPTQRMGVGESPCRKSYIENL